VVKTGYKYYIVVKDRFIELSREEMEFEVGTELLDDLEWEAGNLPKHLSRTTHLKRSKNKIDYEEYTRYQVNQE